MKTLSNEPSLQENKYEKLPKIALRTQTRYTFYMFTQPEPRDDDLEDTVNSKTSSGPVLPRPIKIELTKLKHIKNHSCMKINIYISFRVFQSKINL
jgi:hypothetical protein